MKTRKIAIVGMSFRLPGGSGDAFWERLVAGEDLVTEAEDGRWAKDKFLHPRKSEPGSTYTFASGSVRNTLDFDAAFFGISPREAAQMDPQQRFLMEMTWEALEDSGLKASKLKGSNCGVFIGLSSFDYIHRMADDLGAIDSKTPTGNAGSIAANRISYFLDLRGPSLPIDTACSSSLVAFHQAYNAMRLGECNSAIVGGISLHFHPIGFISFTKTGMLSRDGRCRTFDAKADGYVRSEGGGVVVLKFLDQALKDGDRILAVVEASGVNCDGKTNGITVPSGQAQADLLEQVYTKSKIDPSELDFLEAHGTGTPIGDPIETWAIGNVLGKRRAPDHPLLMGSVKSNLGHLEAASGMAGLMKVLLAFRHRVIPPNLHFEEANPRIDFQDLNLRVVTEATPLPPDKRLLAGINSFGFGGANAHLVLSAPPQREAPVKVTPPRAGLPFILSAKTPQALREVAARTADFIAAHPETPLYDIAHALHERRERLPRRALYLGKDRTSLVESLRAYAAEQKSSLIEADALSTGQKPVLVFTGNGGQWAGMGQQLFVGNPDFRRAVEKVDAIFVDYAPFSLLPYFEAGSSADLDRTELAQPLIFAIQAGLFCALEAAGLQPAATIGHSLGEVAAAWAAGALELEQAVRIIRLRSKHQQPKQHAGGMSAVAAPRVDVEALLADPALDGIGVVVSGENSPRSTTVAGNREALAAFERVLQERGTGFKRLDLPYPFHSPLMDSVLPGFAEELGELSVGEPSIAFYSTVTGQRCSATLGQNYWRSNIREPVLFREAIENAAADGHRLFIELGPHPVLVNHVLHTLQSKRIDGYAGGLVTKGTHSSTDLAEAAWKLVLGGAHYDWQRHFRRRPSRFVELPHYPWQLEEFNLPTSSEGGGLVANDKEHPLLGYRARGKDWEWENHLDTAGSPWLNDHQVGGAAVFPAAGFVEMVLAAGALRHPDQPVQIENFEILTPLVLDARRSKTVRLSLEEHSGQFLIKSRDRLSEDPWQPHVTGCIAAQAGKSLPAMPARVTEAEAFFTGADIYAAAQALGLHYGPAFQAIEAVTQSGNQLNATLRTPEPIAADLGKFHVHPAMLDGAFHSLFALFHHHDNEEAAQAYLPVRADRFVLAKPGSRVASVRAVVRRHSPRSLLADFYLLDRTGSIVAFASGWRFRAARLTRRSFDRSKVLGQRWVPRPRVGKRSALSSQAPRAAAIIREIFDATPVSDALKRYPMEGDALLDALCASFALKAFGKLADAQGVVSLPTCRSGGRLAEGMEDYFLRLACMLVQDGLASPLAEAGEWQLKPDDEVPEPAEIWQSLVADFPEKATRFALAGSVGMHLSEILDGSHRVEEFVPKVFQLSTGAVSIAKSAVASEAQNVLLRTLEKLCDESDPHPAKILWVTGPRPAEENFLAPWLRGFPGMVTVLLPEAAESADVELRLAAYPEVEVANGPLTAETLQELLAASGKFDAIIAPPGMSEEDYTLLAGQLLAGGLLLCCLPERSRLDDFLPLTSEGNVLSLGATAETIRGACQKPLRVTIAACNDVGPSILIASYPAEKGSALASAKTATLVFPLDANVTPWADGLVAALSGHGPSHGELLPPLDKEAAIVWEKLLTDHQPEHLVFVASAPEKASFRTAGATAHQICAISACLRAVSKVRPRCTIHIVTCGAFSGTGATDWTNAALWGFARVARNEFGQLRIRCVDCPELNATSDALADLAAEIVSRDSEDEVLLSSSGRLARRVVAEANLHDYRLKSGERLVLDFDTPGPFQNLQWKRKKSAKPGPGEVTIQGKAAGLNFRDVMYAMGLLPDEALEGGFAGQTLGMELSGVVKEIGPEVEDFQPGDEVIAFAPASFSSETVTSVGAVIPKPPELSFAAAATIPAAFYTAYHALIELAQIQPGERVLIHGAAGGVGIAAIQIATHAGAKIFATAGNEDKRDFVRLLGADHVFNSRNLEFADDIMRVTCGEGIDVVLNSLAGEAVSKNLEILRPFGRLLELGKRDFYENNRIGLRPFRHNIRYFVVDADQVMALRPDMAARGFRELLELFRQRALYPLPLTVFPASEAAEAFRFMQHSSQTGKVVLDLSDIPCGPAPRQSAASGGLGITETGTYLVTGGWSGFGLETARWLVAQGVRSLAVLGRRGPTGDEALRFLEDCRATGVAVLADPCDITNEQSLSEVLQKIRRQMSPLRGIFHAATVIDDALIMNLTPAQAETVLAPKVTGAALLDRLTAGDPIAQFVLYSSATTLFGNPGQAAYVAANAALEELAAKRLRAGLAATCISWGPIGDTGYLSRHEQIKENLAARTGGQALESADALRFLGMALADRTSQVAWMDLDWGALARFLPSAASPRFQMLRHLRNSGSTGGDINSDLHRELERMESAELLETLKGLLKEEVGTILRVAPDKLDENRSLLEVGMDSLMGVELMTSLENNLGISIPIMALSEGPTISRLAERLSHIIRPPENAEEAGDASPLAEQAKQLAAQHAAEVTETDIADLVADIQGRTDS